MSVFRKIILAIIWILVAAGCIWIINNANEARKLQNNSTEIIGNITEIRGSHIKEEKIEKEQGSRVIVNYKYILIQSIRVSYVVDGKEYFNEFSDLESYSQFSDEPFKSGQKTDIQKTKGYQVGNTIELYVDTKEPADAHLKQYVDRTSGGTHTKVLLIIMVFLGCVLSSCVGTGSRRKRY